eukprot:scaffold49092_cov17-Tisochrysis_lutea.AAC.1
MTKLVCETKLVCCNAGHKNTSGVGLQLPQMNGKKRKLRLQAKKRLEAQERRDGTAGKFKGVQRFRLCPKDTVKSLGST